MASLAAAATQGAGAHALDRLLAATKSEMEKVNALILSRADSRVEMVPELARYLIDAGGKRLRPMLTVASALAFGKVDGSQTNFAAAVEFLHNATLLHDDVVDESDLRRGRPAARTVWGNQASVLVGDFLLGQAFLMMVETGKLDALDVLARAATVIAEGEVLQLSKVGKLDTTPEDYHDVIHAKTAALFAAAAETGALAGTTDKAAIAAMREYGEQLGIAFQLVDDVLDYRGESGAMGKNTGDDLREGKMTLPVILALKASTPSERETIVAALGKPDASDIALAEVAAIMTRCGALDATVEKAHEHVKRAREALAAAPAGEMRDILSDIAEFYVSRAY
ncbi:MAG: polyprenyl synthetase family protein [Devosia sp.]